MLPNFSTLTATQRSLLCSWLSYRIQGKRFMASMACMFYRAPWLLPAFAGSVTAANWIKSRHPDIIRGASHNGPPVPPGTEIKGSYYDHATDYFQPQTKLKEPLP